MARLRYVRNPQQQHAAEERNPEFSMNNTVRSLRALYRTDAAIARALLPKPLEAAGPHIFVQFANVCMHIPNAAPLTISAATVGVECSYEGVKGYYVLAMPMEGEFVVIGGRETYGEPKKIAAVDFRRDGDDIQVAATRHDIPFLQMKGRLEADTGPAQFTEYLYCHKALPSIQ
jgi:acetoacetate decarboxylase